MSLAHPYWLLALILLPLIAVGATMTSRHLGHRWGQLVASRLRGSLIRRGSSVPRWLSMSFLLAASALIIIALTRPQGDGGIRSEKAVGRNLLMAIDLSRSMRTDDVSPDRLSLAKLVIYELLEAMPNDRIGLIGFAGEPYLYAPLTIDHSAVRETVEQMDENWPALGGSDIGAAIRLGIETLKKDGQSSNAMVIITDGEMHRGDLDEIIKEAQTAGVYLITVGVGTEDGGYVPHPDFPNNRMLDRDGKPVLSRLQSESLMELARETKGSFAIAGSGADIPNMVTSAISGLEAFEIEGQEKKVYLEFYQWLLLPAILLLIASLIAGTRWRGLAPATAMGLLAMTAPAAKAQTQENVTSSEEITMDYYSKLADKALLNGNRARYRLGEATSAYRLKDWSRASSAYSAALKSNDNEVLKAAHHGLGNTLFQLGWSSFLNSPYTAEPGSEANLKLFENAVRTKLARLRSLDAQTEEKVILRGYKEIEETIINWTDSVRHFQSVLDIDAKHEGAIQNRELTLTYLRKLEEILKDDEKKSEDMKPEDMPNPQPGDGQPDQQNDPGDKTGDNGDPNQQGDNPQSSDKGDPNGNKGEKDPKAKPNTGQNPKERKPDETSSEDNPEMLPGETPEANARRRLVESADSEKGPLTPGRILFRKPEKDW